MELFRADNNGSLPGPTSYIYRYNGASTGEYNASISVYLEEFPEPPFSGDVVYYWGYEGIGIECDGSDYFVAVEGSVSEYFDEWSDGMILFGPGSTKCYPLD